MACPDLSDISNVLVLVCFIQSTIAYLWPNMFRFDAVESLYRSDFVFNAHCITLRNVSHPNSGNTCANLYFSQRRGLQLKY